MISAIRFKNFKALRDTRLELGRYNLVVGPNGSGKSTLLSALNLMSGQRQVTGLQARSVGQPSGVGEVQIGVEWRDSSGGNIVALAWRADGNSGASFKLHFNPSDHAGVNKAVSQIGSARVYALDEEAIAAPVPLHPHTQLRANGSGLAGVLDSIRDEAPERFEQLSGEVARLLPEFDRILFETPDVGTRGFMLRTSEGNHAIRAADLSQGILLAMALLTVSYLPNPPSIIGLEEPDRGIHPRLYRDVQDALYRLSYPESYGIDRAPVQVIVTTHSPFMLDLHKEHPEEIIIAEKTERGSEFHRLSERPDLVELLDEVSLGEAWYSGILGGVPAAP
jgi:predicted ATPase